MGWWLARCNRAAARAGLLCLYLLLFLFPIHAVFAAPESAGPEVDITREGTVQASTTSPGYPASLAMDGNPTTSWFSTGPEPGGVPTRFQWTHARDDLITTVFIHGNGENKTLEFRKNYGFGSVTVQVLDAANKAVFSQEVPLPGTPDPDVTVHPNVVGRTVLLLFRGHESQDCGGISELQVKADRTPAPTAPVLQKQATASATGGTVLASDDLNRAEADRCQLGALNNALGGSKKLYYLPIFPTGGNDASKPIGANLVAGALQNNGNDFGGVQFAESPTPCQGARGTNLGQDLNIRVDLTAPVDAAGHIAQAGLYVRSRAAASGDGIIGGTSAGYWIELEGTGEVKVKRLNPFTVVATSGKPASFNPASFHTLEIAVGGEQLQVSIDGKLLTFDQNSQSVTTIAIGPTAGSNDGTAGIAFAAEANRGLIGGQRAKNIIISSYHPLSGLPVQNNSATLSAPAAASPTLGAIVPVPTRTVASAASPTGTSPATPLAPSTLSAPTQVALNPNATPAAGSGSGDCDGDGKITESDALCALEMSIQLRPLQLSADMDHSGDVTSRDAVILLQRALNK